MLTSLFHNRIGKVCALAAVTLILPLLAHAQQITLGPAVPPGPSGPLGPPGGPHPPPRAPEPNVPLVLIPVVGAALFFSTRRLFSAKAENGR
jgi:hypothetical protein